jgi:serine/threonine-protein kinase RsbW
MAPDAARSESLTFQGSTESGKCRELVGAAMAAINERLIGDPLVSDLELALTEAVANAFRHAYPDDEPGPVRVTLRFEPPTGVTLEVADQGRGLPKDTQHDRPATPAENSEETPAEGGRGFYLIRTLVDTVELLDQGPEHILRMHKKLESQAWK